jgi:hypothetical protein
MEMRLEEPPIYHNEDKEYDGTNWCVLTDHCVNVDLSGRLSVLFGLGA